MRLVVLVLLAAALLAGLMLGRGGELADVSLGGLVTTGPGASAIDPRSLALGLVLGIMGRSLVRIPWLQLPRLLVSWLLDQRNFFGRVALCGLFGAVLIFY